MRKSRNITTVINPRSDRRVLLPAWMSARNAVSALWIENRLLRDEVAALKTELDQCSHLRELLRVRREREQAEASLRELYRQRELERAEAATHDPTRRLH